MKRNKIITYVNTSDNESYVVIRYSSLLQLTCFWGQRTLEEGMSLHSTHKLAELCKQYVSGWSPCRSCCSMA